MARTANAAAQLLIVSLVSVLAMGMWLSASAVVPQLAGEWRLDAAEQSWLTLSVQLGFVGGALLSALLNLADRWPVQRLIAASALLGAICNALITWHALSWESVLILRFLTGAALAGVYPPSMKLVAGWYRRNRGLGIGVLVGALTLGTALPHLLNAIPALGTDGMPPWRRVMWLTSLLAAGAAWMALSLLRPGPYAEPNAKFDWRAALRVFAHRPTRLANFGYLGHMWELYAMWAWVPVLLLHSYRSAGWDLADARLAGFAVVAIGAVGCVWAGRLADRLGRTAIASLSMAVSGGCALIAGLFFHQPFWLTLVCLVWGFAVVADSAQFSAAVSELCERAYVGTALTLQTSLGFLLSMVTIRWIPSLESTLGWQYVFMLLAIGPAFGVASMLRLRGLPEARALAGGRR